MRLACSRSDQNKVVSRAKGNINIKGTVTFVPSVTQQNRDSRSVQDLIFLFLGFVLIKRIRWQGIPRFPCVKPVVKNFSEYLLRGIIKYWAESYWGSCRTYRMEFSFIRWLFFFDVDYFRKRAQTQMFEIYIKKKMGSRKSYGVL